MLTRSWWVDASSPSASALPRPAWIARAPLRSQFESKVARLTGDEGAALGIASRWALAQSLSLLATSAIRIDGRMTRVVESGHRYESEIQLAVSGSGEKRTLRFEARQPETGTSVLEAEWSSEGLRNAAWNSQPIDVGEGESLRSKAHIPVGLGDALLGDAAILRDTTSADGLQVLGFVRGIHSVPQVVVSIGASPASRGSSPSAADDAAEDVAGATALVYVDPVGRSVQTVRVFDAEQRLVRTYEDFLYDGAPELGRLRSFRVSSIPSASHTLFHEIRIEVRNP
ncbi:MAG TPA: hypothetical protein VKE69_11680 [Planctomycetota bacterium]|nr:hypothetical protein [Planctomycetota bacterium]